MNLFLNNWSLQQVGFHKNYGNSAEKFISTTNANSQYTQILANHLPNKPQIITQLDLITS